MTVSPNDIYNHSKSFTFPSAASHHFLFVLIPRDTYNHSKSFTFPMSNSTFGRTSNQNHLRLPFNALSRQCVNPNHLCLDWNGYIRITLIPYLDTMLMLISRFVVNPTAWMIVSRLSFAFISRFAVNPNHLCPYFP